MHDLQKMQKLNLKNLPENYQMRFYFYHLLTWPQLSYVAETPQNDIVGYVLGKMEEEPEDKIGTGHITSISVKRSYRRMGIAHKLMNQAMRAMKECFEAKKILLHVRQSNKSALTLYRDNLEFEVVRTEKGYYGDGEDAFYMEKGLEDVAIVQAQQSIQNLQVN